MTDLDTCGQSYDQWNLHGCARSHSVMDQCDRCTTWECEHWDAVERED